MWGVSGIHYQNSAHFGEGVSGFTDIGKKNMLNLLLADILFYSTQQIRCSEEKGSCMAW